MTTELARVQTEAQKQSFIRNGFDEYVYVACTKGDVCPICKGLDDKHFKVDDMMPGEMLRQCIRTVIAAQPHIWIMRLMRSG